MTLMTNQMMTPVKLSDHVRSHIGMHTHTHTQVLWYFEIHSDKCKKQITHDMHTDHSTPAFFLSSALAPTQMYTQEDNEDDSQLRTSALAPTQIYTQEDDSQLTTAPGSPPGCVIKGGGYR